MRVCHFTYIAAYAVPAILILASLTASAQEEPARAITWKECAAEAAINNPDLVSARERIRQAQADKSITTSDILPQVSSNLVQNRSGSNIEASTTSFTTGIQASQLLFDGFKTPFNMMQEAQRVDASIFNYLDVSSSVRQKLRNAFADLLRAQQLISITEEIADRRKQNLGLVTLLYEAGREHKGSLMNAQADFAQAEFEIIEAKRGLEVARRTLAQQLGLIDSMPLSVKGVFDTAEPTGEKPDFDALSEQNPIVRQLVSLRKAARMGVLSAEAEYFPEVFGRAEAGRRSTDWTENRNEWLVGLSVSLPLFEGRRRYAGVAKAKAIFNQAEADERSGRNSVIQDLESRWALFKDAVENVGVRKSFLDASEERAKITRALYSTGLASFDNWTIIESDLARNKKAYLDAQADAVKAEAGWMRARGETLDYDLK